MKAESFCYWLMGYFELQQGICDNEGFSAAQAKQIKNHLQLVFAHDIDPKMGDQAIQESMNKIHNPLDVGEPGGPLVLTWPKPKVTGGPVMRC